MSLGRDPTPSGPRRVVSEADHGRIPLTKKTFGGLLTRWLHHIEARGRAPKTLVENHRMASAIAEELGSKDLQKLKGSRLKCSETLISELQ